MRIYAVQGAVPVLQIPLHALLLMCVVLLSNYLLEFWFRGECYERDGVSFVVSGLVGIYICM